MLEPSTWTLDRWLAVLGIVIAVIGIPVSWLIARYYYKRSDKKRIPTFVVESTKLLSEPGLASVPGLAVLFDGEDVGNDGITEAKIYFWNTGTLPILQADILEPYTVSLPARILSHSVSKCSRDVVAMEASVTNGRSLTLRFAVLEPGDGATLRVVYASRKEGIEFNGACLDSPRPTVLQSDTIYSVPRFKRFVNAPFATALIAAVGGGGVLAVLLLGGYWLIRRFFGQHVADGVGIAIFFLAMVASSIATFILPAWRDYKRVTAPYIPPEIKE